MDSDDASLPEDPEIYDYPPQPCFLEVTAVHSPYAVTVVLSASREAGGPAFFRDEVKNLAWRLDEFDSKTLILTKDGVDDSFTFKDRKRSAAWVAVLDRWFTWEPL